MNTEEFKNISDAVQSLAGTIAIAVGGAWVLYTFRKLGSENRAKAEIQVIQHEALQEPVLSINIEAIVTDKDIHPRSALIKVTLRNDGKKALRYEDSQVVLGRVLPSEKKESEPAVSADAAILRPDGHLEKMDWRIMRAGQSRIVAFSLPVTRPGLYRIEFSTSYSGLDIEEGRFVPSDDEPIEAHEQSFIQIS